MQLNGTWCSCRSPPHFFVRLGSVVRITDRDLETRADKRDAPTELDWTGPGLLLLLRRTCSPDYFQRCLSQSDGRVSS